MKRKIFLMSLLVICTAILASSTIAYFTAEETAHNVITTGYIDITLVEEMEQSDGTKVPFPDTPIGGAMPGTSVSKMVSVDNTGDNTAWIRLGVKVRITAADGRTELPIQLGDGTPAVSYTVDWTKWTMKDGWYYYNESVAPDASTALLFDRVHFSPAIGNAYQGCTVSVDVTAQATQTANNGDTVMDAAGWPT